MVQEAICACGEEPLTPMHVRTSSSVTTTPDLFRVAVADQGPGLSPEAVLRAGEPFYTTKEPGRGLGLGLFLAGVFAERLGGSLKLESEVGTTATLELPTQTRWQTT